MTTQHSGPGIPRPHAAARHSTQHFAHVPVLTLAAVFVFYAVFWARVGLDTQDGGFILSLSYRVLNGEVPYRDFIYIRPPVSIYLHALPLLAGDYGIYADRLFTLAQFTVISMAASAVLLRDVEAEGRRPLFWWLSVATLVLGIHNFPLFGWHTVDAVFFSALALLALTKGSGFTAGGLAILAALSKQNFALVAIWLGLLSAVFGPHRLRNFLSGAASFAAAFIGFLWYVDSFPPFLEHVLGAGQLRDVLSAGVLNYLYALYSREIVAIIAVTCLYVGWRFAHGRFARQALSGPDLLLDAFTMFILAVLAAFGAAAMLKSLRGDPWSYFFVTFNGSRLLFLGAAAVVVFMVARQYWRRESSIQDLIATWGPVLSLFVIAWTSSISWGYSVPAIFSAPSLVPLVVIGASPAAVVARLQLVSVTGLIVFSIALAHPYGEGARLEQFAPVPDHFRGARLMWSSGNSIDKLDELRSLVTELQKRPFAVLPAFTPASILFGTTSPSLLDWEVDAEIPPRQQARVMDRLCQAGAAVIIEKDLAAQVLRNSGSIWFSQPTAEVLKNWSLKKDLEHFAWYAQDREQCLAEGVRHEGEGSAP